MKHKIKSLTGFKMGAIDGEIGKVEEFYFDDHTWTIRYLVVTTGNWLSGRKVLISSEAVDKFDLEQKVFPVNLTKEQIKNSPDVDTEKPVSRQEELKLYEHYPWRPYWSGFWSGGIIQMPPAAPFEEASQPEGMPGKKETDKNPNLRNTDKVIGYDIEAIDGQIGDVEDFLVDENTWKIHFMIVDTGNWFPGKKVVISPKWVKEINWASSSVVIKASVEQVKKSPEYEPGQEVSDSYEANLQNYYGRYFS